MDKPASIIYDDLKRAIAAQLNASGLPRFVLRGMVKDLYLELDTLAKRELEADRNRYKENEDGEQTHS